MPDNSAGTPAATQRLESTTSAQSSDEGTCAPMMFGLAEVQDIDRTPPKGAQDAARKALQWRDEHGDEVNGMTRVGWTRANQLADGGQLSWDVIGRMAQFARHEKNADVADEHKGTPWKDAGRVAWLGWGGDAGVRWAQSLMDRREKARENAEPRTFGEKERVYIHAHSFGEVRHRVGDFTVDDRFVRDLKEGFRTLTSAGYYPPVLRTHTPKEEPDREPRPIEDGFVYGRMFDVVSSRDERATELTDTRGQPLSDTPGVWYGIETPQWVKTAIDEGMIDNWSPSFYEDWTPPHPELGERIRLAPRHMAFVSVPHQKNTQQSSPHYALYEMSEGFVHLKEPTMADEQTEEPTDNMEGEDEETETAEEGADMGAKLDEVIGMLGKLMDALATDNADDEDADGPPEMSETEQRIAALERENQKLRKQRTRKELAEAGVSGDKVDKLVELSESDPREFAAAFIAAVPRPARPTGQREKGATGEAPRQLSEGQRRSKVKRELAEAGTHGEPGTPKFVAEVQKRMSA